MPFTFEEATAPNTFGWEDVTETPAESPPQRPDSAPLPPDAPAFDLTPSDQAKLDDAVGRVLLKERIQRVESPVSTGLRESAAQGVRAVTSPQGLAWAGALATVPQVAAPLLFAKTAYDLPDAVREVQRARESGDRADYYRAIGNLGQQAAVLYGTGRSTVGTGLQAKEFLFPRSLDQFRQEPGIEIPEFVQAKVQFGERGGLAIPTTGQVMSRPGLPTQPKPPPIEVPETLAQPRETVIGEIRRADARTIGQIQALFPEANLSREQARVFRNIAFPPVVEPVRPVATVQDILGKPPEEPPAPGGVTVPKPPPEPIGGPSAVINPQAAKVYESLPPQPIEGQGQVPTEEGGLRVPSPEEAAGEVPLKDLVGNPPEFYSLPRLRALERNRDPRIAAAKKYYGATTIPDLARLAKARFEEMAKAKPAEAPSPTPEEQALAQSQLEAEEPGIATVEDAQELLDRNFRNLIGEFESATGSSSALATIQKRFDRALREEQISADQHRYLTDRLSERLKRVPEKQVRQPLELPQPESKPQIIQRIDMRDRRDWSKLPKQFEADAVAAAFNDLKELFPRNAVSQRIRASKATTFTELRAAVQSALDKQISPSAEAPKAEVRKVTMPDGRVLTVKGTEYPIYWQEEGNPATPQLTLASPSFTKEILSAEAKPEPPAQPTAVPANKAETAKEPWQQTRTQFVGEYKEPYSVREIQEAEKRATGARQRFNRRTGPMVPPSISGEISGKISAQEATAETMREAYRTYVTDYKRKAAEHYEAVSQAVRAGREVPPEVLADYPDLAKPAPEPPAPDVTTPAPVAKVQSEVSRVARTEGKRSAKEIKDELVSRLTKAVEDAPTVIDVIGKEPLKIRSGQFVSGKAIVHESTLGEHMGETDRKGRLVYGKEIQEALEIHGKKVTIDIPGDGTFRIWNTKEALREVLDRAKGIKTTVTEPTKVTRRTPAKLTEEELASMRETPAVPPPPPPKLPPEGPAYSGLGGPPGWGPKFGLDMANLWQDIKALWQRRPIKRDMAQLADAMIDTIPANKGREAGKELRVLTSEKKGSRITDNPTARKAAVFVIQAKGDPAKLDADLLKVAGKDADAEAAIRYAQLNWDALQPLAERTKLLLDEQINYERANGIDTEYENHYVPQRHENIVTDRGVLFGETRSGGTSTGFKKAKVFPDYASAIEAGYIPRNLDVADLVEHRVRTGQRLVNRKLWADGFRTIDDPYSGEPIVADMKVRKIPRPDGTVDTQYSAPQGYVAKEIIPGVRIAVRQGYSHLFDALTGTSQIRQSPVGRGALAASGWLKHQLLLLDSFHASRTMQTSLAARGSASYNKGLSLLELSDRAITDAVNHNLITSEMAAWIRTPQPFEIGGKTVHMTPRQVAQLGQKNGLNVGRFADALYNEAKGVVGTNRFSRWLFEKLTRGAMVETFLSEFGRVGKANPTMNATSVALKVARDVNVLFGNLQRQSIIKNPAIRDMMQMVFLAPQWVESLARRELRAAGQVAQAGAGIVTGKGLHVGTVAKTVGTGLAAYVALTQLLNFLSRGHSTLENEEGEHKLDAFIPDPTGQSEGFWFSPLSVFGEITHDFIRYSHTEPTGADVPQRIAENKLGPVGRSIKVMATGEDAFGTKLPTTWDRAKEAGLQLVPLPIGVQPIAQALGKEAGVEGMREPRPGALIRQGAGSLGFKIEPYKADESRMQRARQVNTYIEYWKKQARQLPMEDRRQYIESQMSEAGFSPQERNKTKREIGEAGVLRHR